MLAVTRDASAKRQELGMLAIERLLRSVFTCSGKHYKAVFADDSCSGFADCKTSAVPLFRVVVRQTMSQPMKQGERHD
jgi:hypothetical protein